MTARIKSYLHVIIMFVIMFVIGMLPPFGQITPMGMKILGVFLGILYGWIFVDLLWTSLLGFVAIGFTGYMGLIPAFIAGFGNAVVLMVIITAVFAAALQQLKITDVIAYWLLSKKIFIGKPWLLIIALCMVSILMGAAGGSLAALFLLWSVVLAMAEINRIPKNSLLISMVMAVILYGNITGGSVIPFQSGVITYGGFFTQATGISIQTVPFFVLGCLYAVVTMLFLLLISKILFKVDASSFNITEELCEQYGAYKVNNSQKVGLVLLLLYFIGLFIPDIFPNFPLSVVFKSLGVIGFSLLYMFVFVIWKDENNKSVIDIGAAFSNGIPWPVVILLAVTFPLAAALESAEAGVMATVSDALAPVLSSLTPTILIALTTVTLAILTQFFHNVILGALFIPLLAPIVINMGGNPHTFFFMVFFALAAAFATPAGSAMAGLIFGHQDVPRKYSYLYGTMFCIVSTIILVIMMPLCNIMFPY